MASLQPQVDGQERQQRDAEHHGEMVRIAGQRVRPVDVVPPMAP